MRWLIRLFAIMRKEIVQLRRDRLTLGMIVGMPLGQMLLFGYAINTDVRDLTAAVANQADSHLSREYLADLGQSQVLNFVDEVATPEELEDLLRLGKISVGVFIPPDFDRRTMDPSRPAVQLLVDGADPTIASVAAQLAALPIGFNSLTEQHTASVIVVRNFYNPERRTAVNIVPGLIGVILTMTLTLFTAVTLVKERERGNLELLINTPISNSQLMIGKVVPYILIGLVQLALIVGIGQVLFSVPLRGSIIDLYLAAFCFIAANLAIGLLISTLAKTQFQAMQVSFFFLLPSILLSGFMFPFEGMPQFAQYLGEALPNTHFIRLSRGIMLRGASISELQQEAWVLLFTAGLMLTAAIARFSKRLD